MCRILVQYFHSCSFKKTEQNTGSVPSRTRLLDRPAALPNCIGAEDQCKILEAPIDKAPGFGEVRAEPTLALQSKACNSF